MEPLKIYNDDRFNKVSKSTKVQSYFDDSYGGMTSSNLDMLLHNFA